MKRPGVTMVILWEEYREVHPEGYGYSRYVAVALMWRKPGNGLVSLA
jgi:transposase